MRGILVGGLTAFLLVGTSSAAIGQEADVGAFVQRELHQPLISSLAVGNPFAVQPEKTGKGNWSPKKHVLELVWNDGHDNRRVLQAALGKFENYCASQGGTFKVVTPALVAQPPGQGLYACRLADQAAFEIDVVNADWRNPAMPGYQLKVISGHDEEAQQRWAKLNQVESERLARQDAAAQARTQAANEFRRALQPGSAGLYHGDPSLVVELRGPLALIQPSGTVPARWVKIEDIDPRP